MVTLIESNPALAMNNPLLSYAMASPEWSDLVVELPNPNVHALPIYNHLLSSIPSLLASGGMAYCSFLLRKPPVAQPAAAYAAG